MKGIWYYFSLRIKILYRKINDFGLHPFFGFPLIILSSFYILNILYGIINNPYYFCLVFIAIKFILIKRKDSELLFLNSKNSYLIELIEVFILSTPFILISLFKDAFLLTYLYLFLVVILPIIKFNTRTSILNNIDLSFLMIDYEWIYGIRKSFILIVCSFLVILIGLFVSNINISIFGLIFFYIIIGQSYAFVERKELIWSHRFCGKEFIENKIKSIVVKMALSLLLPILLFLFFSPEKTLIIFSILFLVINQMLSKYANYENDLSISISQAISILLSLLGGFYVLFLLFNILFFYYLKVNSIKKINKLFYVENK